MVAGTSPAYSRYAEMQEQLAQAARDYPHLVRLETIGHSHEGRAILLAIITNFDNAADTDKPALWIDANLHSAELVGSVAAMHLIGKLLEGYGNDADITRCLDTRTFYICPRANPDGAEWALADTPRLVRSSTRRWPQQEPLPEGLQVQDIDRDGRVLSMRIRDANGPWKIDPEEPRLLIARDPAETGGEYYRLLPEGLFSDFDGINMPAARHAENLDLNRNFPVQWRGEHEQPGAGPFPASEPEVRALLDFIAEHDNICTTISLHSYSGVLLRPVSFRDDAEMPAEDCWVFDTLGKKGTALTGYPAISAYEGFRYHPQEVITGAMDDWAYLQTGRLAWTVELWDPRKQAGIDDTRYIDWYRDHPVEDDRKLLAWSDRQLQGKGYIDWYPIEHPQLGPVELGGWDSLYSFWNPPATLLEAEITPLADWLIWHNLVSPRLEWHSTRASQIGEALWQIDAVVQNTGWLPTNVTQQARDKKMLAGVTFSIQCPADLELVQGQRCVEAGQLEGRSQKTTTPTVWAGRPSDPTDERHSMQWLVRGQGEITIIATHPRAGRLETRLSLM